MVVHVILHIYRKGNTQGNRQMGVGTLLASFLGHPPPPPPRHDSNGVHHSHMRDKIYGTGSVNISMNGLSHMAGVVWRQYTNSASGRTKSQNFCYFLTSQA